MDINTCLETTRDYRTIAVYSHLFPIIITVVVSSFVLIKTKYSLLSKLFSLFTAGFCLWLLGDVIIWTSNNYNLVNLFWAPLDYINIIFYLFGGYFFVVVVRGKDIPLLEKLILFAVSLPAWWVTINNQSITNFFQPVCEALNNEFLTEYKFGVEVMVIAFIMFYAFFTGRRSEKSKRWQIIVVSLALVLFFSVFSVTEYISSQTGVYEINLYSLFVLPLFLLMIVYSISNLEIFKARLIGFQLLPYILVIMVGSQFFFLENTTDKALTIVTFITSLGFGLLLLRSGKKEIEAREKIEKLAVDLETANNQKDELLGIVSHQLAKPITAIKWTLESIGDGDAGELTKEQRESVETMQAMAVDLTDLVGMILDVSRIQLGRIKLDPQPLDLNVFFKEVVSVIQPAANQKGLTLDLGIPANLPTVLLDKRYTRMTIENLLTNAVKYTPAKGKVSLQVTVDDGHLLCRIADTGCGIPKSEQGQIFGKMFRASNVRNTMEGNGFGLYVAKGAVEAQGGTIGFVSTENKGTTFTVKLPVRVV